MVYNIPKPTGVVSCLLRVCKVTNDPDEWIFEILYKTGKQLVIDKTKLYSYIETSWI